MAGVAGGLDAAREPTVLVEERPQAAEEMDEVAEEVQAEEMGAEGGRAAATEEVGGRAAIGEEEEGVRAGGGAAERQPHIPTISSHLATSLTPSSLYYLHITHPSTAWLVCQSPAAAMPAPLRRRGPARPAPARTGTPPSPVLLCNHYH